MERPMHARCTTTRIPPETINATAEFLLEHGMLDAIVPRTELKAYVAKTLDFMGAWNSPTPLK